MHEQETLENVVAARTAARQAQGAAASGDAEEKVSNAVGSLLAVAEAYPGPEGEHELPGSPDAVGHARRRPVVRSALLQRHRSQLQHRPADVPGRGVRRVRSASGPRNTSRPTSTRRRLPVRVCRAVAAAVVLAAVCFVAAPSRLAAAAKRRLPHRGVRPDLRDSVRRHRQREGSHRRRLRRRNRTTASSATSKRASITNPTAGTSASTRSATLHVEATRRVRARRR